MTQIARISDTGNERRLQAERLVGIEALQEAQALRFNVFSGEFNATLKGAELGLDMDDYDVHCAHIGVRDLNTGALVARSAQVRALVMDRLIAAAADALLLPFCERWQLHLTQAIRIKPGQGAQVIHRDRWAWGTHLGHLEPVLEQLLPLTGEQLGTPDSSWDYLYEPDPQSVIDELLVRYVEALVYQAVAENMASEQSARMVAMKAASDNAKTVIGDLQLVYNKTRQAAITKELSEIVGGAAAV